MQPDAVKMTVYPEIGSLVITVKGGKYMYLATANVTVPMALEDYLPVSLAAIGWIYLARMLARRDEAWGRLAWAGLALITLGGLCKATWKLLIAANGTDVWPLNTALFALMCPGFLLTAWALWRSRVTRPNAAQVWGAPLLLAGLALGAAAYLGLAKGSRAWFPLLIGLTTLGNLLAIIWLMRRSLNWGLRSLAALFLFNLSVSFALARMSDQTVTLQWVKQGINTLSQLAFMFAAMKLNAHSLQVEQK
jgi:hypothetical protein